MVKTGSWKKRVSVMVWACRLILAAAFIYAGIFKNADPKSFATSIAAFEILPEGWINVIALSLSCLEIFSGLLLLIGPWTQVGAEERDERKITVGRRGSFVWGREFESRGMSGAFDELGGLHFFWLGWAEFVLQFEL